MAGCSLWHCRGEIEARRAVIWCVDMAPIKPEGVRMIKLCFAVLQGRILPLTLVWLHINMACRRRSGCFQKSLAECCGIHCQLRWVTRPGSGLCLQRPVWCKGRQMCPLRSDTFPPFLTSPVWSAALSASFPFLSPFAPSSCSRRLSSASPLSHRYTLSQRMTHTHTVHRFSGFSPFYAVHTNQQLAPPACRPSGQSFPAVPSMQNKSVPNLPEN